MKIILVQPPTEGAIESHLTHFTASKEGLGHKTPLGLLYIATYLKSKNHDVEIIDCQEKELNINGSYNYITYKKPDIVGFSTWTEWLWPTCELARLIKIRLPKTHICFGGPHLLIYPEETLNIPFVDSIVVGDGEVPFASLVESIKAKTTHSNNHPGLHFTHRGINKSSLIYYHDNLDSLPIPDRSMLGNNNYSSIFSQKKNITTMVTSRGCPYSCSFCKIDEQKFRFHSAKRVLNEFKMIEKQGYEEVEIYDETFSLSSKRVHEICEGKIKLNSKIKWSIRDRANCTNDGLLELMKKAGCYRILYGIESGSNKILKNINKDLTIEEIERAVTKAKNKNFTVLGTFMFGNPAETIYDIKETIKKAIDLKLDYAEFSIMIPYPGTQIYKDLILKQKISGDPWKEFANSPTKNFKIPYIIEDDVTKEDLIKLRESAVLKFYFRLHFIIKEITSLRSRSDFWRKVVLGFNLLKGGIKSLTSTRKNINP